MLKIRTIYVELTSECNLNCRYCYNNSGTRRNNLDPNVLINYCKNLLDHWDNANKEVFISGGEPLMYANYMSVLRELYKLGFNIYLVTNACFLTPHVSRMISPYITGIQISLDGSQSNTHDFYRGTGSFDKTINNIRSLPPDLLKKTRARITIGKYNYQDVLAFVDFCYSIGIAGVQFGLIRKQGRGCNQFKQEYDLSVNEIYNLKVLIDKKRQEFVNSYFDVGIFDVEGGNCILSETSPSIDMRVDSLGNVYPCHGLYTDDFCMGNIYNLPAINIIKGESIVRILETIRIRRQTLHECLTCIWKGEICHGGCPAEAYMIYGDINHTDSKCELRKRFWLDYITNRIKK